MSEMPLFLEPGESAALDVPAGYAGLREPCAQPDCAGTAGAFDLPFCETCAWRMWAKIDAQASERHKEAARRERVNALERSREISAAAIKHEVSGLILRDEGWVYYLRVGDLVKIGYTADMKRRLREYPPNARLLGAHRGSREDEARIHGQLISHRARGREWFHPTGPVLDQAIRRGAAFTTLRAILREEADAEKRAQAARLAHARAGIDPRNFIVYPKSVGTRAPKRQPLTT